ncbi:hypothetical protein JR316_0003572 [Psilocybe cubensis]|uniref:Uncharacterized protein n=2 Tax=Psilocybe cubensis TaxID=181762 RepID=A0ACB8H8X2_PSICU|nr:hypothetical protein JR316_0003572 [Psilocybe cubensis]KAH9484092.1 hypothetical protein JR316_0003572 [Psilocybe cubensis]
MSSFSTDLQRPTMRRKSSAQNLLSSFKTPAQSSSSSAPVPPPLNLSSASPINSTSLSFASAATPTASTPLPRDWDAQSLHSDTVASTLAGAQSPPLGQGTSIDLLRELVQKRITTLTYLRSIHEGRSHWFHTIQISRAELDKAFHNSNPAIRKRTTRFAILGLSLSTLLDINQPLDLLRGLNIIITEYDQSKEEGDKSRMRIFKGKGLKRGTQGIPEFAGSYVDGSTDASSLLSPSIPFPLDYHQTLLSLLDVLSEVYNKISKVLGPSPFPIPQQQMMGPLGLLAPHPGVSYLFPSEIPPSNPQGGFNNPNHQSNPNLHQLPYPPNGIQPESELSGSLWGIANPSSGPMGGSSIAGQPVVGWSSGLGDLVVKIDSKLKASILYGFSLLKELDELARAGIKDELASLDPLLRNISNGSGGVGQVLYDFEGM